MSCIFCQIDATATDEQTYRALYFVANCQQRSASCEEHQRLFKFAQGALVALTGNAVPRDARPVLRLVPDTGMPPNVVAAVDAKGALHALPVFELKSCPKCGHHNRDRSFNVETGICELCSDTPKAKP